MSEVVKVDVSGEQKPTDYFVLRIQLVHVKKTWFGFKDNLLVFNALIPDSRKEATDLFGKVADEFKH